MYEFPSPFIFKQHLQLQTLISSCNKVSNWSPLSFHKGSEVWVIAGDKKGHQAHLVALGRCRACSTAERTATNIVQAPIARAHRAPRAPLLLLLCSCSCSSRSCAPAPHAPVLLLLTLLLPAPRTQCAPFAHCSLLLALVLPSLAAPRTCAPFAPCSLRSCSLRSLLPSLLLPAPAPTAPCSRCSLSRSCSLRSLLPLGFSTALGHFRAPCVHAIPYLGFASQRLA